MEKRGIISMAHGSGGEQSSELMKEIFGKYFSNDVLDKLEDGAVIDINADEASSIVVSTDSFVVTPIEFKGGDIGKLAVCGTVNDVLMMGAVPKYLTCGFILEEGLEIAVLDRIVESMSKVAMSANVKIIAGDTKVVEKRAGEEKIGSGLMINTTGIGFLRPEIAATPEKRPSASNTKGGDVVIVSGKLGDHHASILSARMGIENGIESDCADLSALVNVLYKNNIEVHTMRDVTRGGLGTVLNEIALASSAAIVIAEESIPVDAEVKGFCGIMGLDPIYMGNEGKFIITVPKKDEELAVNLLRTMEIGQDARCIGEVFSSFDTEKNECSDCNIGMNSDSNNSLKCGEVRIKTKIGGSRRVDMLAGEGLPRIC